MQLERSSPFDKGGRFFRSAREKVTQTLAGFFGALFLLAIALIGIDRALQSHWSWSLVFIPVLSLCIGVGLWDLGQRQLNLRQAVGTIVLLVSFSAVAFATLSFALASTRLGSYIGAPVVTFWHLLAYYGWHFLDLLPAVNAVKTLELTPPIRHQGVIAGLPIAAFKAFVALVLLKGIKDWWSSDTRRER